MELDKIFFKMSKEEKLYEAIVNNNYAECEKLLTEYAYSNILNTSYKQKYPLCVACENNSYDLVELFLKVNLENLYKIFLYFLLIFLEIKIN